jgi:Immunity protein 63
MNEYLKASIEGLSSVEGKAKLLAMKLGEANLSLPTFGKSRHDGTPHIEIAEAYFFVICERGSEYERRKTSDLEEILFWIFSSATFSLACEWELGNRIDGQDCRRQIFSKQEELLARLSAKWATREHADHLRILQQNPFNDC